MLIDPVTGVSYNRKVGLALDADIAILLDAELTSFLGSHLNWNAELTSFLGSHLNWNAELIGSHLNLKSDATQARVKVETQLLRLA